MTKLHLTVGQVRALEGLAKGRRRAIEQAKARAAENVMLVMKWALQDLEAGEPARGRAKRIALDLPPDRSGKPRLTERHVKRILDTLSACPIGLGQNQRQQEG